MGESVINANKDGFMVGVEGVGGFRVTIGQHCGVSVVMHWLAAVCLAGAALLVWGLT
jgi:hypothetical protein